MSIVLVETRLWPRVDRRSAEECWPWLGPVDNGGYGRIWVSAGDLGAARSKKVKAHRVAFRLIQGWWPEPFGLHGCDNPVCCNALNPEHVHEGTGARNSQEMWERGRAVPRFVPKLTDAQVLEIAERARRKEATQMALALEFGISQASVSLISRGLRRYWQRAEL